MTEENLSYYGAIISLVPAAIGVYLALKQLIQNQEQFELKTQEEQCIREQENVAWREKDAKLRERELEAKKEMCRPAFVEINSELRLVMKNETFPLLDVYSYYRGETRFWGDQKTGVILNGEIPDTFFVLGRTVMDEYILYLRLEGGVRCTLHSIIPDSSVDPSQLLGALRDKENWKPYNNIQNIQNIVPYALNRSSPLLETLALSHDNVFVQLPRLQTSDEIIRSAFRVILEEHEASQRFTLESIREITDCIYQFIINRSESFKFDSEKFKVEHADYMNIVESRI